MDVLRLSVWTASSALLTSEEVCFTSPSPPSIISLPKPAPPCFRAQRTRTQQYPLTTTITELRKKVWINQGDIILLSLREYQDNKGDVILKYTVEEARSLKAYKELPENAKINETDTYGGDGDGDCNFEFDDGGSDDSGDGAAAGGKDIAIDDI